MKKNIIVFIITVFFLTSCATSAWRKEQANVHLNIAAAYMKTGQYTLALKELLTAEKIAPDDPEVHYLLGMSYYSKGLPEMAMNELEEALDLNPAYSDVHTFIGTIYINNAEWDKAIESFNKALSNPLYQTPAVALYNMGRTYYEKGQYTAAIKKYEEATMKDPYSVPAYLIAQYTGIAYYALGNMNQAITHLNNSLSIAPTLYESYYWLGQSYLKLNKRKEAISAFQTYLKASPDSEFSKTAQKCLRDLNALQ